MQIDRRRWMANVWYGAGCLVPLVLLFIIYPLRMEARKFAGQAERSQANVVRMQAELETLKAAERHAATEAAKNEWAEKVHLTLPHPYVVAVPSVIEKAVAQTGAVRSRITLRQMVPFSLPGHAVAIWDVELSAPTSMAIGAALARVENRYPLAQVESLVMKRDPATGQILTWLGLETVVRP